MLVDEKVTVSHIELSSDCVWTANKWTCYDTETVFVSVGTASTIAAAIIPHKAMRIYLIILNHF